MDNTEQSILVRDEALARVEKNAGEPWNESAMTYLEKYLERVNSNESFCIDSVSAWAYSEGLKVPHEARAWGPIAKKAKKAGLIIFNGVGNSASITHHRGLSTYYKKG